MLKKIDWIYYSNNSKSIQKKSMSIESFYLGECASPVFLSSSASTPCDQRLPCPPSHLINNDIYLSAITTDNEQQKQEQGQEQQQHKSIQTTQLSQSTSDSHAIISKDNSSIPTIQNNKSLIDLPHKTNNNNNKIKYFFKLLKPSIYKKRNKKIHLKASVSFTSNANSSNESEEIRSNSSASRRIDNENNNRIKVSSKRPTAVGRSATTKKRTSGVLIANPLVNTQCLDVDASNMILYRNRMSLNRRKLNRASFKLHGQTNSKLKATKAASKAKRAFSMIAPIRSFQLPQVSNQVKDNNASSRKQLTMYQNYASSSLSKELTWYKLEELDHYYKILGNNYH